MINTRRIIKYLLYLLIFSLFSFFSLCQITSATSIGPFQPNKNPLTHSGEKVLSTEQIEEKSNGIGDKSNIRKGMQDILGNNNKGIEGVIKADDDNSAIKGHQQAREATMKKVSIGINYSLGLLGVIALIYLIYHGFLVVVKGDMEKGKQGIKTASIAIVGIGLSRFIISLIFWLIENLAPTN